MSMWRDQNANKNNLPAPGELPIADVRPLVTESTPPQPASASTFAPAPVSAGIRQAELKESLIAADISIEGKIEGSGHVRLAGRFKGDVNVKGDLTIERGAKLSGGVRANKVIIAGELEGNIESAAQVDLQASGMLIGDVKAGSLTVSAGSRMRGQAEFGWGEDKSGKDKNGKPSNGAASGTGKDSETT